MGTPCFLDVKTHFLILAVFLPFGSWPLLSQCTKHSFNLFFTQDCFCGKRLLGLPLAGWEQGGRRLEQWLLPTSCSLFGDTRVCCLRVPRHSETVGPSVDGGYTSRHLGIYRAPWCCIHTHVRGMRLHLFSEILICFLTWRITLSSKLIFLDDKEDPSVASSRSSPHFLCSFLLWDVCKSQFLRPWAQVPFEGPISLVLGQPSSPSSPYSSWCANEDDVGEMIEYWQFVLTNVCVWDRWKKEYQNGGNCWKWGLIILFSLLLSVWTFP